MKINATPQYNPQFKLKFRQTPDYQFVMDYIYANPGRIKKWRKAYYNLKELEPNLELGLEIFRFPKIRTPFILLTKYTPNPNSKSGYDILGPDIFISPRNDKNPLRYAYEFLLNLGNGAPNNVLYKKVVHS